MKTRYFYIKDIDCVSIVEFMSRKEILSYMDEYIENFSYDWFDASDDSFSILYQNGSSDSIGEGYDGHKIKRQNILSIAWTNPCTTIVYGPFAVNEYGVISVSESEKISDFNIKEVNSERYHEVNTAC